MEYHRITQKTGIRDILRPTPLSPSEIWGATAPLFLPAKEAEGGKPQAFLPFYEGAAAFLVSARLKTIWKEYQQGGRYRPCAFGSVAQRRIQPYSFLMPRILDCIHPSTRYYKNGDIEELWLDREGIGAHRVFGVRAGKQVRLILSGDVVERMLREGITGWEWETVAVK